jgi:hypothetical protein
MSWARPERDASVAAGTSPEVTSITKSSSIPTLCLDADSFSGGLNPTYLTKARGSFLEQQRSN